MEIVCLVSWLICKSTGKKMRRRTASSFDFRTKTNAELIKCINHHAHLFVWLQFCQWSDAFDTWDEEKERRWMHERCIHTARANLVIWLPLFPFITNYLLMRFKDMNIHLTQSVSKMSIHFHEIGIRLNVIHHFWQLQIRKHFVRPRNRAYFNILWMRARAHVQALSRSHRRRRHHRRCTFQSTQKPYLERIGPGFFVFLRNQRVWNSKNKRKNFAASSMCECAQRDAAQLTIGKYQEAKLIRVHRYNDTFVHLSI